MEEKNSRFAAVVSPPTSLRSSPAAFGAAAQGKSVTFGVMRGCIAVASPVSSIT